MSTENVALVRGGYEALASGDIEGFLARLDPGIEWTQSELLPYGGTHRGIQGMQEVLRLWGATYEEMQVVPDEFLDAGDAVVVTGRYHVRLRSGDEVDTWFVNILDVADGRITRFRDFSDKAILVAPLIAAAAA
jgi:ketosteroid isomerase-like protein